MSGKKTLRGPEGFKSIRTGETFDNCYIVVKTPEDLPPPDGAGVRVLKPSAVYLICGQVTLPDGETLRQSQGTVIEGRHPETDILFGNVDAPLVDGSRTGLLLSQLSIINESGEPTAACAVAGNADQLGSDNPTISSIQGQCSFTGVQGLILDNALICALDGGIFRASQKGIVYRNIVANAAVDDVTFFLTADGAIAVDIEENASVSVCRWSACAFAVEETQTGIRKNPTATLQLVGCQNSQFFASFGPPGTFLDGLTQDDQSDVLFLSNFGIPESSFSGAMEIPSNLTQVTGTQAAGQNVFVRVGAGNINHPLFVAQNVTSRFAVIDPVDPGAPQAQRQVLVYTGPEPITANVEAVLTLRNGGSPNIFQLAASARVVKEPVVSGVPQPPEPQTPFQTVLADGFTGGAAVGEVTATASRLMLNPGDRLYVEIANNTNSPPGNPLVDLIVTNIELSFAPA